MARTAADITAEVILIINTYKGRDKHFAEAFKLIAQHDELAQGNMESFVTNDPRTLWNMATFLLEPKPLTHTLSRIDAAPLNQEEALAARMIEALLTRTWTTRSRRHMRRGGSTWFSEFIGNLTATGWYAVPFFAATDKLFVDYWKPSQIYPVFSDDEDMGLEALARIWELPYRRAIALAHREKWDTSLLPAKRTSNVKITQYWTMTSAGAEMAVLYDMTIVRDGPTAFDTIPVITGGVGGIPANTLDNIKVKTSDPQNRVTDADPIALRGQSIIATNEQVFKAMNRQGSFVQQILHDIANPKTWEKSAVGRPIINDPDELTRRGAHFRLGIDDELGVLNQPGIPAEASQLLFNLRNMAQRGGFSDITFGNFVQEVTVGLMSQAAESAQQILAPYFNTTRFVFTEVSQSWLDAILDEPTKFKDILTGAELEALKILNEVDADIVVIADYSIKIPGDLANRVNLARSVSSKFDLAPVDAMKMFMPEITDVGAAMARLNAAKAEDDPVFTEIRVISAMKQASIRLRDIDPARSKLLAKVAANKEAALLGQQPQQQPPALPSGSAELPSGALSSASGVPSGAPVTSNGASPNGGGTT